MSEPDHETGCVRPPDSSPPAKISVRAAQEISYGHHPSQTAAVLVSRRLRARDRDRGRESALA